MSIAVSDILARVNQITGRELTTVNEQLLEACNDIALRTGSLKASASGTIAANTNSATAPTDMLADTAVEAFYLDDEILSAISYDEYLEGRIRGYCIYNGTIYVKPSSNEARTYTLNYLKKHAAIGANLEFPDTFKPAILRLTTALVYEDYEMNERAMYQRQLYEAEMVKLPLDLNVSITRKTRL